MDEVEKKLSAARSSLIIDKPFLGALVLRMDLKEGDPSWCQTSGTDAKSIYYNYEYIHALSFAQVQFVLAHEALHCALSHFSRRQHRVKHRWDLACDFAINPILIGDGLTPTPDALYFQQYDNMSAEEIYPLMEDNENMMTQDHHLYDDDQQQTNNESQNRPSPPDSSLDQKSDPKPDPIDRDPDQNPEPSDLNNSGQQQSQDTEGEPQKTEADPDGGAPQPQPLTKEEQEQLTIQWQQRMAGAAQQAMQAGKLSGDMARLVDHLLQPQLPWRMLLAQHMSALARDDYNYSRPSKREGSAILPSLRSYQVDLMIVIDTSGSISTREMEEFLSEVNSIKGQVKARITFHACDNKLAAHGPWEFEYWEEFVMPEQIEGGGGTSFIPVFNWLDSEGKRPDLLVYFTDADGEFPKIEPAFPVIWLVKGKLSIPWGQRVQLN